MHDSVKSKACKVFIERQRKRFKGGRQSVMFTILSKNELVLYGSEIYKKQSEKTHAEAVKIIENLGDQK
jgi:hypothetical protein